MNSQGCPGSRTVDRSDEKDKENVGGGQSHLRQWPVQLHLVSPTAPYYKDADVLLCADCVAYAVGNFHNEFLKDHSIAIACPKLDRETDTYVKKVKAWVDKGEINTLTVMTMEVPCCQGLLKMAEHALDEAEGEVPLRHVVVGLNGEVKEEKWVN